MLIWAFGTEWLELLTVRRGLSPSAEKGTCTVPILGPLPLGGMSGGESLCSPSPAWKHQEAPLSFSRYCPQAASSQEGGGHCPALPHRGSGSPRKELQALVTLGL